MRKHLLVFLILLVGWSCGQNSAAKPAKTGNSIYFFDIAGFFNAQIKALNANRLKANKIVRYNAKEDVLKNQRLDYEKELEVFVHSDINKLSWREKYQADTLREAGGEIKAITYKALDDQLKTQTIAISFANKQVERIAIQNHLKSIMASTWQQLEYRPSKGYQVQGKQTMRLSGEDKMGIEVEFLQ